MTTRSVGETWAVLQDRSRGAEQRFDRSTVVDLPEPAQRFLSRALPDGAPLVSTVQLSMCGHIKLGVWMPFTARQILRAGVGFVWEAVVGGRVVKFVGADSLGPDGARMEFRFHGRIPVVQASGPDVHRSAAGRLAAETAVWLPQALTPQAGALWRAIDGQWATVVLPGPTGPVAVDLAVDAHGDLTEILLQRWRDSAKPPDDAPFGATLTSVLEVDGTRVAGEGSVGWDRETPDEEAGVFFRFELTSVSFLPALGSQ